MATIKKSNRSKRGKQTRKSAKDKRAKKETRKTTSRDYYYVGYRRHPLEHEMSKDLHVYGKYLLPKESIDYPKQFSWMNVRNHYYYHNLCGSFVNPIQNQHSPVYCGSCWVINSLDAYATAFNIYNQILSHHTPPAVFSTQEVLNWFNKHKNVICTTGGSGFSVGLYLMYKHINYDSNNVYLARNQYEGYRRTNFGSPDKCSAWGPAFKPATGTALQSMTVGTVCIHTEPKHKTRSPGFVVIRRYDENMLKQIIYMHGSVVTTISSEYILAYKRGIVGHNSVGGRNKTLNTDATDHVISIIGWGEENRVKYWICKNSWGRFWGEEGLFRIVMGKNHLGIESIFYHFNYFNKEAPKAYLENFKMEKGKANVKRLLLHFDLSSTKHRRLGWLPV